MSNRDKEREKSPEEVQRNTDANQNAKDERKFESKKERAKEMEQLRRNALTVKEARKMGSGASQMRGAEGSIQNRTIPPMQATSGRAMLAPTTQGNLKTEQTSNARPYGQGEGLLRADKGGTPQTREDIGAGQTAPFRQVGQWQERLEGERKIITEKEIGIAWETLRRYKQGKTSLENRIVEEEMFFKQRHWEILRKPGDPIKPTSGWMFNSIVNKHADAMDNYPEAICLPREESDEECAQSLTNIIPVVLQRNNFEDTYSDNWWYKLKHGACAYGIFWDNKAEHGLGDVLVKKIDLLNIFWEPGIRDIQKSRNLFICDLVHLDVIKSMYPDKNIVGSAETEIKKYIYDDNVDTSDKVLVVDWYYKKGDKLHFCKFCENNVLFASENDPAYNNGWYEDGEYPIEFDVLYPEEGTPVGFGIISITKDAQLYIDTLDNLIMDYTNAAARARFLTKKGSGINEKDVLDPNKAVIEVEGEVDERRVKQFSLNTLNGYIMNFRETKVDELKETSSNRDFSQGGTMGGVTSGAAIAVLQEAGNKTSRDMSDASYRVYQRVVHKVIERMRQFYNAERVFRITGENGNNEYVQFSNASLINQPMGDVGGQILMRRPVFDIEVKAQKQNPYSTLSQNETIMNLYSAGLFAPENAQAAMVVLELMNFEGKKKAMEFVKQGMTLQNQMMQMQQQMQMMMQENAMLKGVGMEMPVA